MTEAIETPRYQRLLATEDLVREYHLAGEDITALDHVSMNILPGQFIAVVGRSGSGKTTLLNLLAGLDKPTSGRILLEERNMSDMSERELTEIRRKKLGFVFQSFGLLPLLSAFENVELPLRIAGMNTKEREQRTKDALEVVGLSTRSHHRPYELSGGEQQRVAIARAFVHKPVLILADEPTGELDSVNAYSIFGLFKEMVRNQGISVVAATHDSTLLAMADQVLELHDGKLAEREHETFRYRD
ncbi:MAG: ABC transporter ATP-binding protein [Chloroflexi bacterium]|nr:ABC transporter ATP-binding protein [Chloroflexota bacterium]